MKKRGGGVFFSFLFFSFLFFSFLFFLGGEETPSLPPAPPTGGGVDGPLWLAGQGEDQDARDVEPPPLDPYPSIHPSIHPNCMLNTPVLCLFRSGKS